MNEGLTNLKTKIRAFTAQGILVFVLILGLIVNGLWAKPNQAFLEQFKNSLIGAKAKQPSEMVSNQIIVRLKKETDPVEKFKGLIPIKKAEKMFSTQKKKSELENQFKFDLVYLLDLDLPPETLIEDSSKKEKIQSKAKTKNADQIEKFVEQVRKDENVEYAQPNFIYQAVLEPNDPYYNSQGSWGQSYSDLWGIRKIESSLAWDKQTGSSDTIVAVIDTGVDLTHPDLTGNIWINSREIPGNSADDDGNGFIDDVNGWDFYNNDNNPTDDHGHGTHVSGTIGAVGNNNLGVVGVNWKTKIMPIKFLGAGGSGSTYNAVRSLKYAADMGARVLSNSWGGSGSDKFLHEIIEYAHAKNAVIVAAAGNDNSDAVYFSPANEPDLITVSASDYSDNKASFSNWGNVDVSAPGVDILSLKAATSPMCTSTRSVGTNYCHVSGTSMAAPHVSGLAALILSQNPSLTNEQVRQIIRSSADDKGTSGWDTKFGYGRINAKKALDEPAPLEALISSPTDYYTAERSFDINGTVAGIDFDHFEMQYGDGIDPKTWKTLLQNTNSISNGLLGTFDPTLVQNGRFTIRLLVQAKSGRVYEDRAVLTSNTIGITYPTDGALLTTSDIQVTGKAAGDSFLNYQLDYGEGTSPTQWNLITTSATPVENGVMGVWSTGYLSSNNYTLRLTVNYQDGRMNSDSVLVYIDSSIHKGWPKLTYSYTSPTFEDLENDGQVEVIYGWEQWMNPGIGGYLTVTDHEGNVRPGWPKEVYYGAWTPPTVADLDKDGDLEIILATPYVVYAFHHNGLLVAGWPQHLIKSRYDDDHLFNGLPAVGDIDGDSFPEIVIQAGAYKNTTNTQRTSRIYAWKANGQPITGFPHFIEGYRYVFVSNLDPALSLGDLNNDGRLEIITGSYDGKIYVLDGQGNNMAGWPKLITQKQVLYDGTEYYNPIISSPALGDVDKDGQLEIAITSSEGKVYLFKSDGTIMAGWPMSVGITKVSSSPALVDLDKDGDLEVIASGSGLKIWHHNSQAFKNWLSPSIYAYVSSFAVGDINGDETPEIVIGGDSNPKISNRYSTLYAFSLDGNLVIGFPKISSYFTEQSPTIGDIDKDGKMEIGLGFASSLNGAGGGLIIWDLQDGYSQSRSMPWLQFQADQFLSGRYSPNNPAPRGTPSTPSAELSSISVQPTSLWADGKQEATIRVMLKDGSGHAVPGKAVTINVSGSGNIFNQPNLATDFQGQVSTKLKSTVPEIKEISASVDNISLLSKAKAQFVSPASPVPPTDLTAPTISNFSVKRLKERISRFRSRYYYQFNYIVRDDRSDSHVLIHIYRPISYRQRVQTIVRGRVRYKYIRQWREQEIATIDAGWQQNGYNGTRWYGKAKGNYIIRIQAIDRTGNSGWSSSYKF